MAVGIPSFPFPLTEDGTKQLIKFGSFLKQTPGNSSYANVLRETPIADDDTAAHIAGRKSKAFTDLYNLKPTSFHQGRPSVSFKNSDKYNLIRQLKHVLIAKFSHGRPLMAVIKRSFMQLGLKGELWIQFVDDSNVLLDGFYQRVVFYIIPPYCIGCAHLGHIVENCKRGQKVVQGNVENEITPNVVVVEKETNPKESVVLCENIELNESTGQIGDRKCRQNGFGKDVQQVQDKDRNNRRGQLVEVGCSAQCTTSISVEQDVQHVGLETDLLQTHCENKGTYQIELSKNIDKELKMAAWDCGNGMNQRGAEGVQKTDTDCFSKERHFVLQDVISQAAVSLVAASNLGVLMDTGVGMIGVAESLATVADLDFPSDTSLQFMKQMDGSVSGLVKNETAKLGMQERGRNAKLLADEEGNTTIPSMELSKECLLQETLMQQVNNSDQMVLNEDNGEGLLEMSKQLDEVRQGDYLEDSKQPSHELIRTAEMVQKMGETNNGLLTTCYTSS